MNIYYNSLDKRCKSITGAISCSSEITFHVYSNESGEEKFFSAHSCLFVMYKDGEEASEYPMKKVQDGWQITLKIHESGLYFYYFQFSKTCFLGCGELRNGVLCERPKSYQLTVYKDNFETPEWMKGGIMYQIFPDRFYKVGDCPIAQNKVLRRDWGGLPRFRPNEFGKVLNNDFFGGNINGVRAKLPYLKSLNVSVIYFNPIFEAFSNHRYDTGDYMKIDQLLGTVEDFDLLVQEANELGIKIILDGVFNHTGDDSRYFNKYGRYRDELGAHQSPESPYFGWYRFNDFPTSYDSWWGIDTLPAVNENSPSYQNFIFGENGVLRTWLRHGIGGYRLDVADELPDFFLAKLREAVKTENPDAIVIGEVWEDASNKIAYDERRKYFQGAELDSVMNYPFKDAIISSIQSRTVKPLRETVLKLIDHYPKQALDNLMNVLGTHDTPRILTIFGGKRCANKEEMANSFLKPEEFEIAKNKVKAAALLQFTLPGVPSIYYGDENAMQGDIDPFCRRCFDWEHIDEDLTSYYRRLGELRSSRQNIFKDGEYREVFADYSCLIYERRSSDGECVFVYVNLGAGEYKVAFDGIYQELLTEKAFSDYLIVKPKSYGIFAKK